VREFVSNRACDTPLAVTSDQAMAANSSKGQRELVRRRNCERSSRVTEQDVLRDCFQAPSGARMRLEFAKSRMGSMHMQVSAPGACQVRVSNPRAALLANGGPYERRFCTSCDLEIAFASSTVALSVTTRMRIGL
jgi:hypothetical protein